MSPSLHCMRVFGFLPLVCLFVKSRHIDSSGTPATESAALPWPSERFSQTPPAQTPVWHPARPGGARGHPGGGARAVDTWYPRHQRHYATRGDADAQARSTLRGDHVSEEKTAAESATFLTQQPT